MSVIRGSKGLNRQMWVYSEAYTYRSSGRTYTVYTEPKIMVGNIQPDRKRVEWSLNTIDFVKRFDYLKFYSKEAFKLSSEEEVLELIPPEEEPEGLELDFVFFYYRGFVYLIDSDDVNLFNTRGMKHNVFYTRGEPLDEFEGAEFVEGWRLEEYPTLTSLSRFETATRRLGVTVDVLGG